MYMLQNDEVTQLKADYAYVPAIGQAEFVGGSCLFSGKRGYTLQTTPHDSIPHTSVLNLRLPQETFNWAHLVHASSLN